MVNIEMSQQRKLSKHTLSRRSSICETASVGSTKSGKSNGSSEYNSSTSISQLSQHHIINSNSHKRLNGFKVYGSQDSDDGSGIAQTTASNTTTNSGSNNNNNNNNGTSSANILNVAEMILHGVADHEILDIWLRSIQCEDFLGKFIDSGYDMPTISRITPQDLTAIGVTDPAKRLKILTEIKKLNLQDGLPTFRPASLSHWLSLIRLDSCYYKSLCDQQIDTIEKLCQLTWEDFEDLGITKLGHQKRFQLAIERVKELEALQGGKSSSKTISEPIYDTNPSQILLVASTENHSMNGPVINKQPSAGELSNSSQGSVWAGISVSGQLGASPQPTPAQPAPIIGQTSADQVQAKLQNRQSMSQYPFSALANLPKHQQQLLQQSSIYATLSRQSSTKAKQPPPPVPIRTYSLKTNSFVEPPLPPPQVPINGNGAAKHMLAPYLANHHPHPQLHNHNYHHPYHAQVSGVAQCNNITTGRDEEFPPPPSPLSLSDSDEHDILSLHSS